MDRLIKRLTALLVILLGMGTYVAAQGLPAKAFKNVILHKADGATVEGATIVWRDGAIEEAGPDAEVPFDASVIDGGDTLHVYPGFVDGQAYWGSPEQKRWEDTPQRRGEPSYQRAGIRPDRRSSDRVSMDSGDFEKAMKTGFTTAALATRGYMIPGQLDLFFIKSELAVGDIYQGKIGMQMQFEESFRVYPSTVMGVMAQLHQLWSDAEALRQWQNYYASHSNRISPPDNEPVLEALYPVMDGDQRVFFQVDSKEMIERVFQMQDELGFNVVIVSGMEAYKVADELTERDIPVLASIDFPEKPKWKQDEENEEESDEIELTEADKEYREKQWNAYLQRVRNIKTLMDAGVDVGFASAGLELGDFRKNLDILLEHGNVTAGEVLGLLTANTAGILGQGTTLADLEQGRVASFSVMDGEFTEDKVNVLYSVSEGALNEFNN